LKNEVNTIKHFDKESIYAQCLKSFFVSRALALSLFGNNFYINNNTLQWVIQAMELSAKKVL